jgi:predicted nucleic acid-binding protein
MSVLFDTNVVVDVLLAREPHLEVAAKLLSLVDRGKIDGFLSATTVTTIHYLVAKVLGQKASLRRLESLLGMFRVATVDQTVLERALDLGFDDYEDAVLHEAAVAAGASGIVTRNGKDFARARLPIYSPMELWVSIRGKT